ncbi:MAG: cation:proton antiporter [Proteobacteria bacterium]|nr:cation:proton antiporter [Pseudomonadota bacterium]
MEHILTLAALWVGLALIATILSGWLRMATALTEILVGVFAQFIIVTGWHAHFMDTQAVWIQFLAGAGAVLLTFLAGAELDPQVFKLKWKEAGLVGAASFLMPFLGCAALAYFGLHWSSSASWLTGIALSTTSVAVVYAIMLESGLNLTHYGKTLLAACFITDLGTVLALGFMFAPFTLKTLIFFGITILACVFLPRVTRYIHRRYENHSSELESKFLLFILFGLGALAAWAGSEAVLPAYIVGMTLANTVGKNHLLVRRLRTLTLGFLTPFYFIRAGALVSLPALIATPLIFLFLFLGKIITKVIGIYPITVLLHAPRKEAMYTTLLMSTGLTFGTIASLFGLSHGVINNHQYSHLIAVVIGSAFIPTIIANLFFFPRHHLQTQREKAVTPTQASDINSQDVQR